VVVAVSPVAVAAVVVVVAGNTGETIAAFDGRNVNSDTARPKQANWKSA
jgi:hypothetical protein